MAQRQLVPLVRCICNSSFRLALHSYIPHNHSIADRCCFCKICKLAYLGPSRPRLNLDADLVIFSSGEQSNSQRLSAVIFVPASQSSLLWRTPWTYRNFGRAYAGSAESSRREIGVFDNEEFVQESLESEDDSDVEDEQRIEDYYDDDDEEEEEEKGEEDQKPQSQLPAKKKMQTKGSKPKLPDQQGRALNEEITAKIVRLVDDDGKGHRIVSRDEALTLAKGKDLDLVMVDGMGDPPVCKIYDFNKEEYRQEQIVKERKKKKGAMVHLGEVKELRFNLKTESKDLKMKVEQAKEFMNRGYRVKFVAIFKGKPEDEKKRLEEEKMIDAVYPMVEDVATIEQGPRVESKKAWVILRHLKFAKKKSPKRESQVSATEQVESVKQEDQVYSEPDFYQEREEENFLHSPNDSGLSNNTAPPTQASVFQSSHQRVQPPPQQDTVEAFPVHGFPQHLQSLRGFGGLQGSERAVSPPRGSSSSGPTLKKAGVQGANVLSSHPGVSRLPASSPEGFEAQSAPFVGNLPPHAEIHPSHTPRVQMVSISRQNPGILSQKQSPNIPVLSEKAIGSEVTQGEYPATSRGRGTSSPNQLPQSSFSPRPPTSLRGPPPNFEGPLLNLSQSSPMSPNLQGTLANASPSTSGSSSHQHGSSNLDSPLKDFFSSPPPRTRQHAPSSFQVSHVNPSTVGSTQNVPERCSTPLQGSEGSQGVTRYPPPPLQGFNDFSPRGVPRYPAPPVGQPRYMSPLGQPSSQSHQGEFATGKQNQQMQGPDFIRQVPSQLRPALDAAAQEFSHQQNCKPGQGNAPPTNSFGSPQSSQQGPPNFFGSPQCPQQGPPNLFGSAQGPQQRPPNLFGSPQHPQQVPPNLYGSPQRPQQRPANLFEPPQQPQQGPTNLFGPPPPQQGPPNLFGPQSPQQGPPNLFGRSQLPQRGPPNPFKSSECARQGSPPNLVGSLQGPPQEPPNVSGSPPHPQQGSRNLFRSPIYAQQGHGHLFGSPPTSQEGHPEPSRMHFGSQPVGVPQGPQQGGPWLSQEVPSRSPSPMPSHPQSPSQSHQGHSAPLDAKEEQNYWHSQALQGFPPLQNRAPQGHPPKGAFGFHGNQSQTHTSQESRPPRALPQTRPVMPSASEFRQSWSSPSESQEYSPLFESDSDKT